MASEPKVLVFRGKTYKVDTLVTHGKLGIKTRIALDLVVGSASAIASDDVVVIEIEGRYHALAGKVPAAGADGKVDVKLVTKHILKKCEVTAVADTSAWERSDDRRYGNQPARRYERNQGRFDEYPSSRPVPGARLGIKPR